MKKLRKKISKLIKKYSIRGKYLNDSYAQNGEDMIISDLLQQTSGFYVDVGAHHPKRYSNTYRFYRMGWRGINIDPVPGMKKMFAKLRNKDINLEMGVAPQTGEMTYYIFNEPALNSFDSRVVEFYKNHPYFKIIDQKKIAVAPLSKILDENLPQGSDIDFLTIDVEGLDYQVLQSNNWEKYRPRLIVCEVPLGSSNKMAAILDSDLGKFLSSKGYELVAKTSGTMFFKSL